VCQHLAWLTGHPCQGDSSLATTTFHTPTRKARMKTTIAFLLLVCQDPFFFHIKLEGRRAGLLPCHTA
jgi:hypothetical protein